MLYNNIIYATEQEARSYLLPTSTQVLFMDPNAPIFYVKSTDAFGAPSFESYDFTARTQSTTAQADASAPITRADLDSLKQELITLITNAQTTQPQEDTDNG